MDTYLIDAGSVGLKEVGSKNMEVHHFKRKRKY